MGELSGVWEMIFLYLSGNYPCVNVCKNLLSFTLYICAHYYVNQKGKKSVFGSKLLQIRLYWHFLGKGDMPVSSHCT